MKTYKRIAFDIDNTLTFLQPTLDLMAEHFNCFPAVEDDILSFRLSDAYPVSREQELDFWLTRESEICQTSVFADKRVNQILKRFSNNNSEYLYITNRDSRYLKETQLWLEKSGLPAGDLLLLGKQSKLKALEDWEAEVIFEDNPAFFLELESKPVRGLDNYCIDYPYNRCVSSTGRISRLTGKLKGEEHNPFKEINVPKSFLIPDQQIS